MFFQKKYHTSFENHHGDSINPDFAKWVVDFISSFSNTFWIIVFLVGFLIIFISFIFILILSRKK